MATPGKIAGTATVAINGQTFEVGGAFSWSSFTVKFEAISGMSTNFAGYKETPIPAQIEFQGFDYNNFPLSNFQGMNDVTIVANLANGKVITGQDMTITDAVVADVATGEIKMRFVGPSIVETLK